MRPGRFPRPETQRDSPLPMSSGATAASLRRLPTTKHHSFCSRTAACTRANQHFTPRRQLDGVAVPVQHATTVASLQARPPLPARAGTAPQQPEDPEIAQQLLVTQQSRSLIDASLRTN